jgi:hypothetical protein
MVKKQLDIEATRLPDTTFNMKLNRRIYRDDLMAAAMESLETQVPSFVVLYNRCATNSNIASHSFTNTKFVVNQKRLELDILGDVVSCSSDFWKGTPTDVYSITNLNSTCFPAEMPGCIIKGSPVTKILVEATRSMDVKILEFKLCKMEKALNCLRGRRYPPISICILATENRDAARRVEVRRQLEKFVEDNAGSLKMLAQLCAQGKLLLMQVHGESRHKENCSGHL